MEKKINKTKLGELAKDLNVSNADIVKCLETYDGETRKTQASLMPEEVSYVLEYFTQNNQVENFNEYFANNVRPEGEKKPEPKKTTKKAAAKTEEKPEVKAEEKAAEKPKTEEKPKAAEKKEEPKEEVKAEVKPEVKAEKKSKKSDKKHEPAKKKDFGVRTQLSFGGSAPKDDKGYTLSSDDDDSYSKTTTIDTRGSYVELDKYNEKYDNLANTKHNRSKDSQARKQKLVQKSQQHKKQQFSHKRETEAEKLRRLELERARKQQLKVMIPDEIVVSELASRLKVTASVVIKKLMGLGVMAGINEVVDFDTAAIVADELGAKVEKEVVVTIEERLIVDDADKEEDLQPRCPVVGLFFKFFYVFYIFVILTCDYH